jgi:hypothetical protein
MSSKTGKQADQERRRNILNDVLNRRGFESDFYKEQNFALVSFQDNWKDNIVIFDSGEGLEVYRRLSDDEIEEL